MQRYAFLIAALLVSMSVSARADSAASPKRAGWTVVLIRQETPAAPSRVADCLNRLPDRLRRHCADNADAELVAARAGQRLDARGWRERVCVVVAGQRMGFAEEFARLERLRAQMTRWRAARGSRGLDLLVLNMCGVSRLEVGYLFRGEADYLLAPQRRLPCEGLEFSPVRAIAPDADGLALGWRLWRASEAKYEGRPGAEPALALCRLAAAERVAREIRAFAQTGSLQAEDAFDLCRPVAGADEAADAGRLFEEVARHDVAGRGRAASAVLRALLNEAGGGYIVAGPRRRGRQDSGVSITFPAEAVLRETAVGLNPHAADLLAALRKTKFARCTGWHDVFPVVRETPGKPSRALWAHGEGGRTR